MEDGGKRILCNIKQKNLLKPTLYFENECAHYFFALCPSRQTLDLLLYYQQSLFCFMINTQVPIDTCTEQLSVCMKFMKQDIGVFHKNPREITTSYTLLFFRLDKGMKGARACVRVYVCGGVAGGRVRERRGCYHLQSCANFNSIKIHSVTHGKMTEFS